MAKKKINCKVLGKITIQECWSCYYTNGSNFPSRAECRKANEEKGKINENR